MTERLRTPTAWLAAFAVWLTVQVLVQQEGLIAHDTRLDLLLNPGDFLARTWHLWDVRDMGRIQNQAVGYLFPMGPVLWLGHLLSVPPWITERLWIALLLGAAFWGLARVADELSIGTPITRMLGAASYALSPFFISRVGNTSSFVEGAALLPWLLLPLIRGARGGSPRRAAFLSGLALFAAGGVNALGTAAVLVVPALWLVTRERGPRRQSLMSWWLVAVIFGTAWWAIPLLFQGRYGMDFLPLTERADLTTAFTAPFDVIRGSADWLAHIRLDVPPLPAGWTLVTDRPVIAATGLVAALAVFGFTQRTMPERTFLTATFLAGVALVGSGYHGPIANPAASQVGSFLDGPGAALRSIYKFQPVIMLPLALGFAHGASVLIGAVERRRPSHSTVTRAGALLLFVVLILASARPLLDGELLNAKPFSEVPAWWTEAGAYLASSPGRTLLVPGLPQADFEWGYTAEDPLYWLTSQPWASRSLIPLGSYGAIRYLDVVEEAIARGGDPALAPFLARGGFSTVLVANDANWRTYRAPPPDAINSALRASGLLHAAAFGPDLNDAFISNTADLHQVEAYTVPATGNDARVAVYSTARTAVVSGDPGAPLTLENWGLADRGLVLASDRAASEPEPLWIVTDSNRRRFTNFGTTRHNQSYVLAVGEPGPLGAPAAHGMFPGDQLEDQTVAIRGDVGNVTASSYGSVGLAQPVWAPGRAFDGDASTAWVPAAEVPLVGQWVTAELPRPASVDSVDVQLLTPSEHPDAVGSLRVTTEQGSVVTTVDPGRDTQHLSVPPGETSWIRITFQSVAPGTRRAGIREVSIAGFAADQRLEVPSQLAAEFSDTTQPMPVYVFSRVVTNPRTAEELDPETSMRRRFTVPHSGSVNAEAKIAVMPGDAALKLLDATSSFEVTATSTFGSLPRYAPRNLVDRDPNTFWVSGTRDDGFTADANPHLTMRWNGVRTVDRVVVKAARGYSSPTSLRITSDSEQRTVPLDAATGDTISFSALTSDHVDIELLGSTAASTAVDRVGLSALEFPSLQDLAPGPVDRTQVVHVDCSGGPVVDVAGVERRFSVDATLGDVIDLRAVDASPCDSQSVALSAGEQDLDTRTGSSPFAIAGIRLMDSSLSTGDEPSRVRDIEVAGWGNEVRAVRIGPGEASYLAINENANDGWKASLNGRALQPVTLDGWRQGYLVPAGESGLVELRYEPTGSYRAALIIGLVLVVLLLIGAVIGGRRSRNLPMVNEGTWPASARLGVPVALAFAIGGVYALAMMAGWIIVRRLQSAMAKIIGLLVVAASLAATLPTETVGGLLGASGSRGVSILVVAAVSGAAATLLLRDAPGTSRSTTRVPTVPSP